MVFTVRCFKCGAQDVKLILGGRQILHARCQSCHTNLLAEILAFEQSVIAPPPAPEPAPPKADDATTDSTPTQATTRRKPGRDAQPTRELAPLPVAQNERREEPTREIKLDALHAQGASKS
jgi:hypothetical protein